MCDYDPPTFFEAKDVTARKEYKCIECDQRIMPGETYERVKGLWDGRWDQYRTCMLCSQLRKWVADNDSDDGCWPAFGYLNDHDLDHTPRSLWSAQRLELWEERILERFGREGACQPLLTDMGYWKRLANPKTWAAMQAQRIKNAHNRQDEFNYHLFVVRKDNGILDSYVKYCQERLEGAY